MKQLVNGIIRYFHKRPFACTAIRSHLLRNLTSLDSEATEKLLQTELNNYTKSMVEQNQRPFTRNEIKIVEHYAQNEYSLLRDFIRFYLSGKFVFNFSPLLTESKYIKRLEEVRILYKWISIIGNQYWKREEVISATSISVNRENGK